MLYPQLDLKKISQKEVMSIANMAEQIHPGGDEIPGEEKRESNGSPFVDCQDMSGIDAVVR